MNILCSTREIVKLILFFVIKFIQTNQLDTEINDKYNSPVRNFNTKSVRYYPNYLILNQIICSKILYVPVTLRQTDHPITTIKSNIGDVQLAWTQLVRGYKNYIQRIASKYPVDQDELESAGLDGLMDAVEKFDPSLGNKFQTYACQRIQGAILDKVRERRIASHSSGSRLRFQLLDKLHHKLDQVRSEMGRASEEQVRSTLASLMDESGRPLADPRHQGTFNAILELHNNPSIVYLDAPLDRFDPGSRGSDLKDPRAVLDLDLMEGCPIKDCSFPLKDNFIYHIPSLTRREMIMLDLYSGASLPEPMTMKEIGELFGLSESRISQQMTSLVPLLAEHQAAIKSGRMMERSIAVNNDPFYKLLLVTNRKLKLDLELQDLKQLEHVRHLLTDDDNRKIKTIRGGDNEYSIPPLNKDLERIWGLTASDTERTKRELAEKSLLFTRAQIAKSSNSPHLNLAVKNILSILAKTKSVRMPAIRSFVESLGYNPENIPTVVSSTEFNLYDLLTKPSTLEAFTKNSSSVFNTRQRCAAILAQLLLNEPKTSKAAQLITKLPTIIESLVQKTTNPVLIEAQELSALDLLTTENLKRLFVEYEGRSVEDTYLTSYVRRHGLKLSRNNFWNLVNEPKTKARILAYAQARASKDILTHGVLRKAIKKYTGHDYKSKAILAKFAKDNGLKIYHKRFYLGLSPTAHQQVKKQVGLHCKNGRIAIGKLREIISACAPTDFALVPDAQIKRYAQFKLGINLEAKKRQSRLEPYREAIIKRAKEQSAQQNGISLIELNAIVKSIAGFAFKGDPSLIKFADSHRISLSQRSGVSQVKAPKDKPKPSQPRIKLSDDHVAKILTRVRTNIPKGLLTESRLNAIVYDVCGQSYPDNSSALKNFAKKWNLQLRTEKPRSILEDVDKGLPASIAIRELLLDCQIFIDPNKMKQGELDLDTSIRTLATQKIDNLDDVDKYHIVKKLVMAPADSEIGQFVRNQINYQRIIVNLAT